MDRQCACGNFTTYKKDGRFVCHECREEEYSDKIRMSNRTKEERARRLKFKEKYSN